MEGLHVQMNLLRRCHEPESRRLHRRCHRRTRSVGGAVTCSDSRGENGLPDCNQNRSFQGGIATSKVLAGASNEACVTDEEAFGSGEVSDGRRFLDEIFPGCVFRDGICPVDGGAAVLLREEGNQIGPVGVRNGSTSGAT